MSNPYISKNQMEKIIVQQEGRLNAVMALIEAIAKRDIDRICGFDEVVVENFSKGRAPSDLKMRIAYDEKTDTLALRVEESRVMCAIGSLAPDTEILVDESGAFIDPAGL